MNFLSWLIANFSGRVESDFISFVFANKEKCNEQYMVTKLVVFWEYLTFKEIIMEMAILVIGIGAVALWFFYGKDGRKE